MANATGRHLCACIQKGTGLPAPVGRFTIAGTKPDGAGSSGDFGEISGARTNQERDGIQELLRLSRQGAIQKVLVCEVSRLGRSTVEVLQVVDELTQLGVSIHVQNFGIETLKNGKRNPVAQFLFTLLAEFARLERESLRERILSGIDEARRQGKRIVFLTVRRRRKRLF